MQAKKPFICLFKNSAVELKTSVTAVDLRDAVARFFSSNVGMPLAHANSIPVDLIQDVPANFETRYTLAQDGWSLHVNAADSDHAGEAKSLLGDIYVPEGPVRNTILAALRLYQEMGMGDPANRSDHIHDIATNGDDEISMDEWGIEELCQSINFAVADPCAKPLVIVRSTSNDEILVQASHAVKVLYLEDNETGDDSDDLVVLDDIEMWKQEFDVVPSDLGDLIPQLKLSSSVEECDMGTVVLEINGGVVNSVRSDRPVRVLILDEDCEGGDSENIQEVNGQEVYVSDFQLTALDAGGNGIDPEFCRAVQDQILS
ncbi:TPA: hypothetical protein NHR53_005584 [Pseudomonas aeruginosa]|nr:hypothetical protein [Pseudomonas aeruginosa]HCE8128998.1 hypothetical protein [Pseudomonas aeruginosa]HCF0446785.1 hypothetical protein [Pseudomonas aeruginosa]